MPRLIAATDFSGPAGFALDRAASLASLTPDADLTIMYVHSAAGFEVVRQMLGPDAEEMERRLIKDAEDRLRALAADLEAIVGRPIGLRLPAGPPVSEIAAAASELSACLVVMGAHGKRTPRTFLLGGTVERVMRKTGSSVLAVKRPVAGPYRRILIAVDFSRYSQPAIELAFRVNPGAEVVLLHAFEAAFEHLFRRAGATKDWVSSYRTQGKRRAEEEMEKLAARVEAFGIRTRRMVVRGSPAPAILRHARQIAADLIVVGRRGESTLSDFLVGGVARRVVANSTIDALVASASFSQTE